jgi:hypothetical protein
MPSNLCPFRPLFNFGKNRKGLSQVNKVDDPFCNEFRELLNHHVRGHCHGGESTCQARVRVFSSEQIAVTLSTHPTDTIDLPFVLVQ